MQNKRIFTILLLLFMFTTAHIYMIFIDAVDCQAQIRKASSATMSDGALRAQLRQAGINLTPEQIRQGRQMQQQQKNPSGRKTYQMPDADEETQTKVTDDRKRIEAPKEISVFNRSQKIGKYQDVSRDLKPFGYDFFHGANVRVLTERQDIPVPLNYVVGPGDEINILLWGRMNAQLTLIVDRDGKITIPDIGPVQVAGMTFDQMSKHLIAKTTEIVGTNTDISMGSTRTIPIFVLGDVERPGSYTIGALSTITDALMMARGPSAIGSMRRVELRRKEKVVTQFDLYDLFLKGDKSRDVVLQAGDVVFVPVAGPLVGVAGNVKRPAIYELKDKFTLQHLFDLAGGVIPGAYTQQMQVERVVKNEKKIVIDINDKTLEKVKDFVIQDADLVKVFSIVDIDENAVYLKGNVKRPGKYSFQPGMKIKDIINNPDDLQNESYLDYALIKRESPPNREISLIPVDLGKLLLQNDESYNYELTPKDQIFIFHQSLFKPKPFVTVEGEIRGFSEPLEQYTALKDNQYGAVISDQDGISEQTPYGVPERDQYTTAPGRYDTSTPGQYGALGSGKYGPTGSSQSGATGPGQYGAAMPNQSGATRPGQHGATMPSKYGPTGPGKYPSTGQYGVEATDQYGTASNQYFMTPDQYIVPYDENLVELRKIKAELNYEYDMDQYKDKDEKYYLLMAKIEEIENEVEKEKRLTPGAVNQLQIELEKIGRKDLALMLDKLESKMKIECRIDLDTNMKVKDAILYVGGLTQNASMEDGEIIRQLPNNSYKTVFLNIARAMAGDPRDNLLLQDRDRIIIHSIWEKNPKKHIFVTGDVTNPGTYQYTENMTVRDLIFKAGSVLDSAYLDEAEISSVSVVDGKLGKLTHRTVNLRKVLEGNAAHNVALAPNDRLHVKQIADFQNVRFVTLSGQVSFPGKYPFRKGEKLSDIIERAGGFTPYAYLRGSMFTRLRVKELQQKGLLEMADRMERELFSAAAAQISTALSSEEVAARKGEQEQKQRFVETLRKTKAQGRMTIYVADAKKLKNTEYDFELEDGDELNIPEKNSVVNVIGSVMAQGSHLYSDKLGYQDYIDAAGGYSYYADSSSIYILKVDGGARKISNNFIGWNSSRSQWEMTAYGGNVKQIEPGDTIVVPEKAERIAWMRDIKDITTIMMNIAVVAGVAMSF